MNLLNKIDKETFHQRNFPILFQEDDDRTNKRFALISNGTHSFKFAWHSDLVEPVVKEIIAGLYGVGIDQHFSIADFNSGEILLTLNLFYNFYDIEIFRNFVFVISELEIIKISISNPAVAETYALPDFFIRMEFKEGNIAVECANGETIVFDNCVAAA